jgi:hypothetical protein
VVLGGGTSLAEHFADGRKIWAITSSKAMSGTRTIVNAEVVRLPPE